MRKVKDWRSFTRRVSLPPHISAIHGCDESGCLVRQDHGEIHTKRHDCAEDCKADHELYEFFKASGDCVADMGKTILVLFIEPDAY
jgi:hypothetical protein